MSESTPLLIRTIRRIGSFKFGCVDVWFTSSQPNQETPDAVVAERAMENLICSEGLRERLFNAGLPGLTIVWETSPADAHIGADLWWPQRQATLEDLATQQPEPGKFTPEQWAIVSKHWTKPPPECTGACKTTDAMGYLVCHGCSYLGD